MSNAAQSNRAISALGHVWDITVNCAAVGVAAHIEGGGKEDEEKCHACILWGSNIEPPPTTSKPARKTLA